MKKLISIALLALLLIPAVVLASNISEAEWSGVLTISNNSSTANTNVSTVFTANTTALIATGYMNSSGNNTAIRTSSGADVAYMPGYGTDGNPWAVFVPEIDGNTYQSDILYMGGTANMESKLAYFPGDIGMTIADAANLEPSDNFSIEFSGSFDTVFNTVNKTILDKTDALSLTIPSDGIVRLALPSYFLSFDGGNDKANKDAAVVMPAAGTAFTVEFWYKKDSNNTDDVALSSGVIGGGNDYVYTAVGNAAGNVVVLINDDVGGQITNFTTTNTTADLLWHYITITYDDASEPETRVYVDGHEWSGVETKAGGPMISPTTFTALGARWNGAAWGNWLAGDMDNVRISDIARTLAEHIAIFGGASVSVDVNTISLWKFNSGAGNPTDDVGNNTLVLDGATYVVGGISNNLDATVTSGEHVYRLTADGTDFFAYVDGVLASSSSVGTGIVDNGNDWIVSYNATVPYIFHFSISKGGIERSRIIWEYTDNFTDLSGNLNAAIPSFRGASSDSFVSATLASFQPIAEADAPPYTLFAAPDFITALPEATGNFTSTINATYPGHEIITQIAIAGAVPEQLPVNIMVGFFLIVVSLSTTYLLRSQGSGSLLWKGVIIMFVMGVFVAVRVMDVWQIYFFVIMAIGMMWMSRQREAY